MFEISFRVKRVLPWIATTLQMESLLNPGSSLSNIWYLLRRTVYTTTSPWQRIDIHLNHLSVGKQVFEQLKRGIVQPVLPELRYDNTTVHQRVIDV